MRVPGIAAATTAGLVAGMSVIRFVVGPLSLRVAPVMLLAVAFVVAIGGWAILWTATTPPVAIVGLFVAGLGYGAQYPLSVALLLATAPGRADATQARATLAGGLAIGVAPFALGALSDAVGTHRAFLVVPVVALRRRGGRGARRAGGAPERGPAPSSWRPAWRRTDNDFDRGRLVRCPPRSTGAPTPSSRSSMPTDVPLADTDVVVAQERHAFLFGNIGFDFVALANGEGAAAEPPAFGGAPVGSAAALADLWLDVFNAATLPFYWGRFEPRARPTRTRPGCSRRRAGSRTAASPSRGTRSPGTPSARRGCST